MIPTIILTTKDSRYYKACIRDSFQRGESPLINPARISWLNPMQISEDEDYLNDCYQTWHQVHTVNVGVYLDQNFPSSALLETMVIAPKTFNLRAFLGTWDLPSYDIELVYDERDGLYYSTCYDAGIYCTSDDPKEALDNLKHEYLLQHT